MAYLTKEVTRLVELFLIVEGNKEPKTAAPTYKDSPYLKEMAEIVLPHNENDAQTLEESIAVLSYLAECYDKMCRAGMSVKFYTPLLEAHTRLMKLKKYDDEYMDEFENSFYQAIRARNYYEPDACDDLVAIVKGSLSEEKIKELLSSAQKKHRSFIKNDPIEKTEEYLAVIDMVEQKIDENKTMDFCLEYWNLKAEYLMQYGICWRSPVQMNPGVLFD